MCKTDGYSYDELRGSNAEMLVYKDFLDKYREFMKIVKRGKAFSTEAIDLRKDGTCINVQVKESPINFKVKNIYWQL